MADQKSKTPFYIIAFIVLAIVAVFGLNYSQNSGENMTAEAPASSESFERAADAAGEAADKAGEAAKQAAEGMEKKFNELAPAAGQPEGQPAPAQQ